MKKSEYTRENPCNCGCSGSGLGSSTGIGNPPCGCRQGLGEPTTETQKDLITEAKKYINGEIPTKVKVATGIGVIGLLLLAKKRGH